MPLNKKQYSVSVRNDSIGYDGEPGIDLIKELLPKLEFRKFDNEIAHKVGEKIRTIFYQQFSSLEDTSEDESDYGTDAGILITIKLFSGLTLYQAACGGNINPTNEEWVRLKYNTVKDFGKPSFLVGKELVKKGRDVNSLGPDYAAHGGAYPIMIQGVGAPIGAIIVSGMTQDLDHTIISVALQELLALRLI